MAFGAEVLKRGLGLVWFPEGRRSPNGSLRPFRTGVGLLLEHYPVPVLPVYMWGTEKILPPGGAVIRPGTISLVFGRPVHVEDLVSNRRAEEKKKLIAEALHERVLALGDVIP